MSERIRGGLCFSVPAILMAIGLALTSYCYMAYIVSGAYPGTDALPVLLPFLAAAFMCVIVRMVAVKSKGASRKSVILSVIMAATAFVFLAIGLSLTNKCYMAYSITGIYDAGEAAMVFMPYLCVALFCAAVITCISDSESKKMLRVK